MNVSWTRPVARLVGRRRCLAPPPGVRLRVAVVVEELLLWWRDTMSGRQATAAAAHTIFEQRETAKRRHRDARGRLRPSSDAIISEANPLLCEHAS